MKTLRIIAFVCVVEIIAMPALIGQLPTELLDPILRRLVGYWFLHVVVLVGCGVIALGHFVYKKIA